MCYNVKVVNKKNKAGDLPLFLFILKLKMKILKKQYKKIKKYFKNIKFDKPKIEDVFFVFLLVFSLTFSAMLFGIGKQLQEENRSQKASELPSQFEKDMKLMVSGHPIERMIPFIAKQDKFVAAYMIAIAKKESNWGKYHPEKNGKECFNYWGYRGTYNQTASGYSCFKNPKQAVNVVSERIQELIDQEINTPGEMVVWKCGRECSQHSPYSVNKWIEDVDLYYKKTSSLL